MSNTNQKPLGIIAEFEGTQGLLRAAEQLRDSEYERFDCHSPFPIHGLDAAMGEKPSLLGWLVAGAAISGFLGALLLQYWTSAVDYKLIIAGKPLFSYPAFFPVTFSVAVLASAGTALLGMLAVINLKFHHPVFYSERFKKVTDDGFFVSIMADDKSFDEEKTKRFLEEIGGQEVEVLRG